MTNPMPAAENLASLVGSLGAQRPRRLPAWLVRMLMGDAVHMLTVSHRVGKGRFRAATGWKPVYPSANDGWTKVASTRVAD